MADLFTGSKISDNRFTINDQEFHHCIRVTRHRAGDRILVTQWDGQIYEGLIESIEKDVANIHIHTLYKSEQIDSTKIAIAISLTHPVDRLEWFIEKAVENGIHEIFPMVCERTEVKKINEQRIHKLILSAAKQSLRPLLPILHPLMKFDHLMPELHSYTQKFIGYCSEEPLSFLGKLYHSKASAVVMIGPAGDFSSFEIKNALSNQFNPVSLGQYRLRTETAGLTALQIMQTIRQL